MTPTPKFLDRLSAREKRMVALCAAAILMFVVYLSWPDGETAGVELAGTPPAATTPTAAAPPPAAQPAQAAPAVAVPSPPVAAPAQPAAPPAPAFVLQGVFGGGPRGGAALIAAGGQTRRVPIGREVAPGVTLKSVGIDHAVLVGPGGEVRLELARSGTLNPVQTNSNQ